MARRNRETLKNYFRQGSRPTQHVFEDLIDSTLNTLDDGFSGSPKAGLGLSPVTDDGVVISTYRSSGDQDPVWEIAVNRKNGDLEIRHRDGIERQPVLTLKHQPEDANQPYDLVLQGTLSAPGRRGSYKTGSVPADGHWHDVFDPDTLKEGCWAFEVVAGCGERNKGRYALVVATAMHCYGSRPVIRKTRSCFGIFGNHICLRWVKSKDNFTCRLQMKTFFSYGNETRIQYEITRLWDNPTMEFTAKEEVKNE